MWFVKKNNSGREEKSVTLVKVGTYDKKSLKNIGGDSSSQILILIEIKVDFLRTCFGMSVM